jgi:hypothetical protein
MIRAMTLLLPAVDAAPFAEESKRKPFKITDVTAAWKRQTTRGKINTLALTAVYAVCIGGIVMSIILYGARIAP